MAELPSRLKVEARGRILGDFGLIEAIPWVERIILIQNLPGGFFTAHVEYEGGVKDYLNVCGYKLGHPDLTEMTLDRTKPLMSLTFEPHRNIGVYEGRVGGRIRDTVYFYG